MVWRMPILRATLNFFTKCSRGYVYFRGYIYSRVQSTSHLHILLPCNLFCTFCHHNNWSQQTCCCDTPPSLLLQPNKSFMILLHLYSSGLNLISFFSIALPNILFCTGVTENWKETNWSRLQLHEYCGQILFARLYENLKFWACQFSLGYTKQWT